MTGIVHDCVSISSVRMTDQRKGNPRAIVIPGRAPWREPGIHNPKCQLAEDY